MRSEVVESGVGLVSERLLTRRILNNSLRRARVLVPRQHNGSMRIRYDDLLTNGRAEAIRHQARPGEFGGPWALSLTLVRELTAVGLSSFDVELLTGRTRRRCGETCSIEWGVHHKRWVQRPSFRPTGRP